MNPLVYIPMLGQSPSLGIKKASKLQGPLLCPYKLRHMDSIPMCPCLLLPNGILLIDSNEVYFVHSLFLSIFV
jgi:hypothetical protein